MNVEAIALTQRVRIEAIALTHRVRIEAIALTQRVRIEAMAYTHVWPRSCTSATAARTIGMVLRMVLMITLVTISKVCWEERRAVIAPVVTGPHHGVSCA